MNLQAWVTKITRVSLDRQRPRGFMGVLRRKNDKIPLRVLTAKSAHPSLPLPLRILQKIRLLRSLPARILAFEIRRVRIRD
jgi:hypothetical protein